MLKQAVQPGVVPSEIRNSLTNCAIGDATYLDNYNNGSGEFEDGDIQSVDGLLQPDGHGRADRRASRNCPSGGLNFDHLN